MLYLHLLQDLVENIPAPFRRNAGRHCNTSPVHHRPRMVLQVCKTVVSFEGCFIVCICLSFRWCLEVSVCLSDESPQITAASSSGAATLADNSVSLPEASGPANKTSSLWPHPHPAWQLFRDMFTSTHHRVFTDLRKRWSQLKGYLIFLSSNCQSLNFSHMWTTKGAFNSLEWVGEHFSSSIDKDSIQSVT